MQALAKRLGEATGDYTAAGGSWFEVFDVPMTAHFLGGATIGSSPERGVVDAYHRVWGYPGLSVVDGAAVSANLGVNPSLTITAQAERAMSLWPNRGEADPPARAGRAVCRRCRRSPARRPAVPAGFPVRVELGAPPAAVPGDAPAWAADAEDGDGSKAPRVTRCRSAVPRSGDERVDGRRCEAGHLDLPCPGVALARGQLAVRHGAAGHQRRGRRGRR